MRADVTKPAASGAAYPLVATACARSWEDAQKARQRCVEKYNQATERGQKQSLLRDCLILAFHTLQPVRFFEESDARRQRGPLDAPCSPCSLRAPIARRSPTE